MEFKSNRIAVPRTEGAPAAVLMQRCLDGFEVSGVDVLEVGPKHGLHTRLVDAHGPKSITLVELEEKRGMTSAWLKDIKSPTEVFYQDLLRFNTGKRFGLILLAGIIYHNTEQLRLLKKVWALGAPGCKLVFESATTRTPALQALNVIEVHWPRSYRDTGTVKFLPSKQACVSMLEMAGWRVLDTSDRHQDEANPDRITVVCERIDDFKLVSYADGSIDHSLIED